MSVPEAFLNRQIITLRVVSPVPITKELAAGLFSGNWTLESRSPVNEYTAVECLVDVIRVVEETGEST